MQIDARVGQAEVLVRDARTLLLTRRFGYVSRTFCLTQGEGVDHTFIP
jgi:hypothetical protein